MEKWDDVHYELPKQAKTAISMLQTCITDLMKSAQYRPFNRKHLYKAAMDWLTLRSEQWALYGSWAWNRYFPLWAQLDPSDIDIKLLNAQSPEDLSVFVEEILTFLRVRFVGHQFTYDPSRHNENRTLIISCDQIPFMDVSLLDRPNSLDVVTDTQMNFQFMSLEWMLRDLSHMLSLPTAHYRREKDLQRLARLCNCSSLRNLRNITSDALRFLAEIMNAHQDEFPPGLLLPSSRAHPSKDLTAVAAEKEEQALQFNRQLREHSATVTTYKQENSELLQKVEVLKSDLEHQLSELRQEVEEITTQRNNFEGQLSEKEQLISEHHAQVTDLSERLAAKTELANQCQEQCSRLEERVVTLTAEKDELSSQCQVSKEDIQSLVRKIKRKNKDYATLATRNTQLLSEAKAKQLMVDSSAKAQQTLSARLERTTAELADLKNSSSSSEATPKAPSKPPKPPSKSDKKDAAKMANLEEELRISEATCQSLRAKLKRVSESFEETRDSMTVRLANQNRSVQELTAQRGDLQKLTDILMEKNEKFQRDNSMLSRSFEQANNSASLALRNFIQCQKQFQSAVSTLLWQNGVQLLSVGDHNSFSIAKLKQSVPTNIAAVYCRDCYRRYLDQQKKSDDRDAKFLLCSYAYQSHIYEPNKMEFFDYEKETAPYRDADTLGLNLAPPEKPDKDVTGMFLVPLMKTIKPSSQKSNNHTFYNGQQVFIEDATACWTLCPMCLLMSVEAVITKNHKEGLED